MDATSEPGAAQRARRGLFETYRVEHRCVWIQTEGSSMRPTIPPGTWMKVAFGDRPHTPGEIVLFTRSDRIVAHRVITLTPDSLTTKGDSSAFFDAPVMVSDILGVALALRRTAVARPRTLTCSGTVACLIAMISAVHGGIAGRLRHPILRGRG